jgi:hypothetical protein
VRAEDVREIDALIGMFMQGASPPLLADLVTLRQGLRNRTLLTQFGVRVTD